MQKKKAEAPHWFQACNHFLGYVDYLDGNYAHAIVMFDSSMLPQYNYASMYSPNNYFGKYLYKAVCLIKLRHYRQGRQIFETLNLGTHNYGPKQVIYQALSEGAGAAGDAESALRYYKLSMLYSDSLNIEGQQGRVFELQQKYQLAQREADITTLKNKSLQAELLKNRIVIISTAVLLLMVVLAVYLYQRYQRQKQQKELELLNQRKAISANMHDEVNSGIAALRFLIADFKDKAENAETKAVLADIEEEASTVYIQSRNFMHHISNNDVPEDYDVPALLQKLALRFNEITGLHITADADVAAVKKYFTQKQQAAVYRIINEALANTVKHSGADEMTITLKKQNGRFYFEIADNGKGFTEEDYREGLGLKSIRQRVNGIKGQVTIKSSAAGTIISGSFPVQGQKRFVQLLQGH
jgi:signal transduction histidine kinase